MGNIQEDLNFLATFHNKVMNIANKFKKDLAGDPNRIHGLQFIQFSKLDNWFVGGGINNSKNLCILGVKLHHMINKGDNHNIKPMLDKIATGRLRTFRYKTKNPIGRLEKNTTVNAGKGHFRLGTTAITLTDKELNRFRKYFKYT